MFQNQVTIGPEFFANAFKDYENRHWAFVRELLQNAMDADGCTRIEVNIKFDGENTRVECSDNGCGMSEDVLINKLLSLGGSGKNFEDGKVGGFGKAKEILYFAQEEYWISTNRHRVHGKGAAYNIEDGYNRPGCFSTILWNGNVEKELLQAFRWFASLAQWPGNLWLNGEFIGMTLRKGSFRREFSFAKVYTNRSHENLVVVRMGGIPMFTSRTNHPGCVIVELTGTSEEVLTANRDALRGEYRHDLHEFLVALTVDKKSALRSTQTVYHRFPGEQLRFRVYRPANATAGKLSAVELEIQRMAAQCSGTLYQGQGVAVGELIEHESDHALDFHFVVKNSTGLETPGYYLPGDPEFGNYALTLAKYWANVMLTLHRHFKREAVFSVGFCIDQQNEAEYERGVHGDVFYINPTVVVEQANSSSRSLRKRFKLTERHRLLAIAVHEFVHAEGYTYHDENYASRLTDRMGEVMSCLKDYNPCFR